MKHWKLKHGLSRGSMVRSHIALRNPFGFPSYAPAKSKGHKSYSMLKNPVDTLKHNLVHPIHMDSVYDMASATVGAIGTYAIPSHWLVSKIPVIGQMKVVNLLLGNAINITLMGTASKMLPWVKSKPGVQKNLVIGGLVMTGLQLFGLLTKQLPTVTVLQKMSPATAMAGLGAGNEALRARIEAAVKQQLMAGRTLPYETIGERTRPFELMGERTRPYETMGQSQAKLIVGEEGGVAEDTM